MVRLLSLLLVVGFVSSCDFFTKKTPPLIEDPVVELEPPFLIQEWRLSEQKSGTELVRVQMWRHHYSQPELKVSAVETIEWGSFAFNMPECLHWDQSKTDSTPSYPEYVVHFLSKGESVRFYPHAYEVIKENCDPRGQITYNVGGGPWGARGYLFFDWPRIYKP